MRRGERVLLTLGDQTKLAEVVLVSMNGRSLLFSFDGMLRTRAGAYCGAMAVLQDDDGTYRDLAASEPVTICRAS